MCAVHRHQRRRSRPVGQVGAHVEAVDIRQFGTVGIQQQHATVTKLAGIDEANRIRVGFIAVVDIAVGFFVDEIAVIQIDGDNGFTIRSDDNSISGVIPGVVDQASSGGSLLDSVGEFGGVADLAKKLF